MNKKFGYMECRGCKAAGRTNRVLVRVNDRGTLIYKCDECDAPAEYAPTGSQKHADWLKAIELIAPPAAAGAAQPAVAAVGKKKAPWER